MTDSNADTQDTANQNPTRWKHSLVVETPDGPEQYRIAHTNSEAFPDEDPLTGIDQSRRYFDDLVEDGLNPDEEHWVTDPPEDGAHPSLPSYTGPGVTILAIPQSRVIDTRSEPVNNY